MKKSFLRALACSTAMVLCANEAAHAAAVANVNGKAEVGGGALYRQAGYFAGGSISVPAGESLGVQVDGMIGSWDSELMGGVGAHLFWRDPTQGLIGAYASYSSWNYYHTNRAAAEAEIYLGNITLSGIVGGEGGDVPSHFFDNVNAAIYLEDNLRLSIGHRYIGQQNAAAFSIQYQLPSDSFQIPNGNVTLFAEARAGEGNYQALWAGVRIYFGEDKSLMRRQREDDPNSSLLDDAFDFGSGAGGSGSGSGSGGGGGGGGGGTCQPQVGIQPMTTCNPT